MELDSNIQFKENFIIQKVNFGIVIDETVIKVGSKLIYLWVITEPLN